MAVMRSKSLSRMGPGSARSRSARPTPITASTANGILARPPWVSTSAALANTRMPTSSQITARAW